MCMDMSSDLITLSDAMAGSEKDQWQRAIKEELKSFNNSDSWELVDRPEEGTVVKNK